jgi:serine protease AprX
MARSIAMAVVLLGAASVHAQSGTRAREEAWIPVIVHLRGGVEPQARAASHLGRGVWLAQLQAMNRVELEARGGELAASGARQVRVLWVGHALTAEVSPSLFQALARDPRVAAVLPDRALHLPPPPPAGDRAVPWNLQRVGAPALWARGALGAGVVVGLLDTGADGSHPELAPSWRGGTNSWLDPFEHSARPIDPIGHGTQALGLIVGQSSGVAPGASWIAARIFDDQGVARLSTIHLALQWMLDPDGDPATDDGADVISNSWDLDDGVGRCDPEFDRDLQSLDAAGVAVVFAAGNGDGAPGSSQSPANSPFSFSVGASTPSGEAAVFSARGPSACDARPFPDLLAPGVGLRTTDLSVGGAVQDPYAQVTGTSFAAPQVAGGIALLLGEFPDLTTHEIEGALRQTARPGSRGDGSGGEVDLEAAAGVLAGRRRDPPRVVIPTPRVPPLPASLPMAGPQPGCGSASSGDGGAGLGVLVSVFALFLKTSKVSWRST